MKEIKKRTPLLNSQQKIIFAIFIPICLFFLFYYIADEFDGSRYSSKPFEFGYTWWVWMVYFTIIGLIEFILFENRQNKM